MKGRGGGALIARPVDEWIREQEGGRDADPRTASLEARALAAVAAAEQQQKRREQTPTPRSEIAEPRQPKEGDMAKGFRCKDCPDREPFETKRGWRRHRTVAHGDTPATNRGNATLAGRKTKGRRTLRRGAVAGAGPVPRGAPRGSRAGSNGAVIGHEELVLLDGILRGLEKLSPAARAWLVQELTKEEAS